MFGISSVFSASSINHCHSDNGLCIIRIVGLNDSSFVLLDSGSIALIRTGTS